MAKLPWFTIHIWIVALTGWCHNHLKFKFIHPLQHWIQMSKCVKCNTWIANSSSPHVWSEIDDFTPRLDGTVSFSWSTAKMPYQFYTSKSLKMIFRDFWGDSVILFLWHPSLKRYSAMGDSITLFLWHPSIDIHFSLKILVGYIRFYVGEIYHISSQVKYCTVLSDAQASFKMQRSTNILSKMVSRSPVEVRLEELVIYCIQ